MFLVDSALSVRSQRTHFFRGGKVTYFVLLAWNYAGSTLAAVTQQSAFEIAFLLKSVFSTTGKMRLFKAGFFPNYATTWDDLLLHQCDYSGYPEGGATLTWGGPLINPTGGCSVNTECTFAYAAGEDPLISNTVGGGWIETSTGKVFAFFTFPSPATLAKNGDGFIVHLTETVGLAGPPA